MLDANGLVSVEHQGFCNPHLACSTRHVRWNQNTATGYVNLNLLIGSGVFQ